MDIFWTLAYTTLTFLLLNYLYRYLMKPFDYWKDRGVASVPAIPILGSLYGNFNQAHHEVLQNWYKKYGRVYGAYESSRPVLSVGDPELIKDILVKDFRFFSNRRDVTSADSMLDCMVLHMRGEEWKRVRTIITPAFSSGKIKKMVSIILDASKITLKNFDKHGENGKAVDCKKIFGAFTMDVIARSAFGTVLDSYNDPENIFTQHAKLAFTSGPSLSLVLFMFLPKIYKLLRRNIFPTKATNFFRDVTLEIIKQRKATGQRQNDFLQLLMDEADEARNQNNPSTDVEEIREDESEMSVNDPGHDQGNKNIFCVKKKCKGLSQDELVAQCVLFFLAGYETTASALSFAAYLLAVNPECQEILIKEIDDTLRKNQNTLTYEAVQSMKYLDNVVLETLRIYPPAILTERQAERDYELGETGINIPKGMIVSVPIFPIHHDPEFYKDPEKFDPNRFTQEEKDQRNPYSFIPFGAGPRNCIGMRFALIEIKFCIAALLSQFRLKKCPETKVPLEFLKGQVQGILQPSSNLLGIERRNDFYK